MKRIDRPNTKTSILVVFALLVTQFVSAEILFVVNSQSRTLSRIDTMTDDVNNSFATLGNVPNKIVVDSEYIWVVNSGDNAVQKISTQTGATISNVHIGIGSNPWDAVLHQNYLYVTGLFSGKVYKVDIANDSVVDYVTVGTAPEALHIVGDNLYVSNAGNYSQNYAGSSVSVIDLETFSVLTTIPVNANPQYLASYNGMLHVSCTGNWADVGGAICIIDTATNSLAHTINLGGTPGCIWITDSELALVADANGANLYSYNPLTFQLLHGVDSPLPNGGSEVVGNSSLIAVLTPNWSGNGSVKVLHPDLSLWKQYSVAMMPTDLKMSVADTDIEDQLLTKPMITVYPNPVRAGSDVRFSSAQQLNGVLRIFNSRGQQIECQTLEGKNSTIMNGNLPSGIYFYRFNDAAVRGNNCTGRFMVIR